MSGAGPNPAIAVACLPYLDAATCGDIVARAEAAGWGAGRLGAAGSTPHHDVRRCRVSAAVEPHVVQRVERDVAGVVDRLHGFDLTGLHPDDPVLVMRYDAGDHFAWHLDDGVAAPPIGSRKIAFTVQLSPADDYEGGDLELAVYALAPGTASDDARRRAARQQGTLIVFPAFHLHRVAPVTSGTRRALVGWLHGPPFR